jgi:chromosome segregation ATPase
MSDTKTYGVRVGEDFLEKIKGLQDESGLPGQEFLERLTFLYEMDKAKEKMPIFQEDINELETHLRRITGIYGNMVERMKTFQDEKEQSFQAVVDDLRQVGADSTAKILELEEQLKAQSQETKAQADTFQNEINKLTDEKTRLEKELTGLTNINIANTSLIGELQDKNKSLKAAAEEAGELRIKLEDLQGANNNLSRALDKANDQVATLSAQVEEIKETCQAEVERLNERHQLEKERAVFDIQKNYEDKLAQLREEYANQQRRYEEKLAQSRDEYTGKVKELLEQIQKLQTQLNK